VVRISGPRFGGIFIDSEGPKPHTLAVICGVKAMSAETIAKNLKKEAELLADVYFDLLEKYTLLDPLLFNAKVKDQYSGRRAVRGLELLQAHLFLDCVKDAANLAYDKTGNTLSIHRWMDAYNKAGVRKVLRDLYIINMQRLHLVRVGSPGDTISTSSGFRGTISELNRKTTSDITVWFDKAEEEMKLAFTALNDSPFREISLRARNHMAAHRALVVSGEERRLCKPGELGSKWGDLRKLLPEAERFVLKCQVISNLKSYSDSYWSIPRSTAASFWKIPESDVRIQQMDQPENFAVQNSGLS
jgi:hypothetical protein